MKIAVVIDTWFPAVGGGQINALEISKRIAKKGISIDIITRNNGVYKTGQVKYLNVYRLGSRSSAMDNVSRIVFLIKSFIFIKKRDYDIIHLQAFLPGLLAPLIRIFIKKPVIFTVHGTRMFEEKPKQSFGFWLEKLILTKIKYNTQISVTKAFMRFKNVNKNIIYIPNGIDLQKFNKVKVKKANYPKILWVGRFDPVKRVDNLILAMKTVNAKIPKAKLALVGYGQEEKKLKDMTKSLRVKNVQFVGKKEGLDLIKEYKSSHVFVLPSASEGQPLTILEALASNLQIVAANVGGIPEMVNNSNGFLIQPNSINSLADAIINILVAKNHPIRSNSLKNFNWKAISLETMKVYEKIINANIS